MLKCETTFMQIQSESVQKKVIIFNYIRVQGEWDFVLIEGVKVFL
jgi:hypothetical protein